MPGGRCFSDVFQPLPGSLEPGLRLRLLGRGVTVLRRMLEDEVLLLSVDPPLDGCQTQQEAPQLLLRKPIALRTTY